MATPTLPAPDAVPATKGEPPRPRARKAGCSPSPCELDDLILRLRVNESLTSIGIWLLRTAGDPATIELFFHFMLSHRGHWLAGEILNYCKRSALKRLDVTSLSLFA